MSHQKSKPAPVVARKAPGPDQIGRTAPGVTVIARKRRPRKRTLSPELRRVFDQDRFLQAYPLAGSTIGASRIAKVNRASVYEWLKTQPEFKARLEDAKVEAIDHMREQAQEFIVEDRNATVLMFLMRKLDPELRDQPRVAVERVSDGMPPPFTPDVGHRTTVTETRTVSVENEGPVMASPKALTDGELAELKRLLKKAGADPKRKPAGLPPGPVLDVSNGVAK